MITTPTLWLAMRKMQTHMHSVCDSFQKPNHPVNIQSSRVRQVCAVSLMGVGSLERCGVELRSIPHISKALIVTDQVSILCRPVLLQAKFEAYFQSMAYSK